MAITRSFGKKVALAFSVVSLAGMGVSGAGLAWLVQEKGWHDVLTASAIATLLFFASVAFVLYFISKPPLHELQPWDAPE